MSEEEPAAEKPSSDYGVWLTMVSAREVPHLSKKAIDAAIKRWPEHERDAREHGIPGLGSGNIYRYPQSKLFIEPFDIPAHWPKAFSLDVGWRNTAALWFTKSPLNPATADQPSENPEYGEGIIYIFDEYKGGRREPSQHVKAIKEKGASIPGVIDPASNQRSQRDGQQLLMAYRSLGLQLKKAINSVDGGITMNLNLLNSESIKVFSNCVEFRKEYRNYRRDISFNIVKRNDHLMDAWRYFVLSGLDLLDWSDRESEESDGHTRESERVRSAMRRGAWMI